MKILDISLQTDLGVAGAARLHTLSLAQALRLQRNDIFLVVGGNEKSTRELSGIEVTTCNFTSLESPGILLSKIARVLRNNVKLSRYLNNRFDRNLDIVYERHSIGSFIGYYISRSKKLPLIFEVNGIPDEEIAIANHINNSLAKWMLFNFTKCHLRLATAIFVQTEELKAALKSRYGLESIFVVPNGADIPNVSKLPMSDRDSLNIFFMGTVDDQHNLGEILEAFQTLEVGFTFTIVGDGEARAKYQKKLEGDLRFVFTGRLPHDDAINYLKDADICLAIYGTQFELYKKYGFYMCPMKIFEYMSYGKPIVYFGFDSRLTKTLTKNGAIVSVKSEAAFRDELYKLLKDPNVRKSHAESARLLSRQFTWTSTARKTLSLMREIKADEDK